MSAIENEFKALAEKYGLDPEAVKASVEATRDAKAREANKPKIVVDAKACTVLVEGSWAGVTSFPESKSGNPKLYQTNWVHTGARGPNGGEIQLNLTVIEKLD